jgi:hypothetical protein
VFSNDRSAAPGPSSELSEELGSGLSQPRWMSESPPSVHPGSSFLPYVRLRSSAAKRGRQDADGSPGLSEARFGVSNLDGGVRVACFVFVGAAHVCKWALGCTELPGVAALMIAGFQVSATDEPEKIKSNSTLSTPARGIRDPSKGTTAC